MGIRSITQPKKASTQPGLFWSMCCSPQFPVNSTKSSLNQMLAIGSRRKRSTLYPFSGVAEVNAATI